MAEKFLILILFLISQNASAQNDARSILNSTANKCKNINSGTYTMEVKHKYLTKVDTTVSNATCSFFLFPKDTLLGAKTRIEEENQTFVYNTNEFFRHDKKDNSFYLLSLHVSKNLNELTNNLYYRSELFGNNNFFMDALNDVSSELSLSNEELVEGINCYVISRTMNTPARAEFSTLRHIQKIYVDKKTFYPIRITEERHVLFQKEKMIEYDCKTLFPYSYNIKIADSLFELPVELINPKRSKADSVLTEGTNAPDFNFISLRGTHIQLSELRGKVVLLCFWYKDNYNCMKSLSIVNGMEKRPPNPQGGNKNVDGQKKELLVIGINAVDADEKDKVDSLLVKRNITCENVLTPDKTILKNYHITGYPTFYVIDANGIITRVIEGYGEYTRGALDRAVKKAMEN